MALKSTLTLSFIAALMIGGALTAALPAEARAAFATGTVANVQAAATSFLGGADAAANKTADYKAAIRAGTPLTADQAAGFKGQAVNVIVACDGPAGNPEVAQINKMLAESGGDPVPCGAFNPDLAGAVVAADVQAGHCTAGDVALSDALVAAGGTSVCA